MQYFPLFLLILLLLVLVTRPFTVLFHELGHALPAILLTKEKVTIYIGSYGDPTKSLKLKLGLLELWFRYNPFSWRLGLCVPSAKDISINRQILYILTGPLTSLCIAIIICFFAFIYDFHGLIKLILVVFLGSAIFDLIGNLIPIAIPIKLYDGTLTYNDGYNLKRLFYFKRLQNDYAQATELYNQQKYSAAASAFCVILSNGFQDETIYRLAISSNLQTNNFEEAEELVDKFVLHGQMTSDDFSNAGFVYLKLGFHEKALEFYRRSLHENPDNRYSLNNMGYTLNLINRFAEAIPLFDKAIELEPLFAFSYNNRGLAKIKLGSTEQGLADIKHSLELDKNNSYAYMNLGIYYFDKGQYKETLELFNKAKELDSTTYLINEHIAETEKRLL